MNPLLATQDALVGALTAIGWEWPAAIRAGATSVFDDLDPEADAKPLPLPGVICDATNADQVAPNLSTYVVDCSIQLRTAADDVSIGQHHEWASDVSDFVESPGFIAYVTAEGGIECDFINSINQTYERIGRLWVTTINFQLHINPKTS